MYREPKAEIRIQGAGWKLMYFTYTVEDVLELGLGLGLCQDYYKAYHKNNTVSIL